MSKREYQHKIETLNEMMTAISDTPHDNIWDANFALWAIAERLEALVEILDSMRGSHCLNVEAQVTTRGV